jgi:adenosylhomocysteine nucleosidase
MIAITFALPAESSGILGQLSSKHSVVVESSKILYGQLQGRDVAILHTGVGRKQCEQRFGVFLESVRPELVISSGFAGSLTEQLSVGDVIVAENFSDASVVSQIPEGRVRPVKLHTADTMVDSAEERTRIAQQHGATAIDMETDMIAKACHARGIRMLSLRVISDSPAAPFPAPPHVLFDLTRQKTNFAKLVVYVLMHPTAAGRLARFAQQISRARGALTDAILNVIANVHLR